jgi:CBS domain-containing protein
VVSLAGARPRAAGRGGALRLPHCLSASARRNLCPSSAARRAFWREAMLVSEILRIKGTVLYTTPPDAPVLEAVRVMAQHDIGSLVVMDRGRMAGMLTFAEVLQALADGGGALGDLRIAAIYDKEPVTASPGLDVMELRRVMLERHARYVPVMDGTMLLGVVSFHDVAKAVYEEQSFENRMLKSYIKNWPGEEGGQT